MADKPIAVLGGGNTAFAVAARLSLAGTQVVLCEHPEFAQTLTPIGGDRRIRLIEGGREQSAQIYQVSADIAETLAQVDLALAIVPAYAHRPFAQWCLPHLRQGHTIVLMPGTLGSLEWSCLLREAGKGLLT